MKLTSLIAIGAVLIMIVSVGCSNNNRTTGPANINQTLQVPGDNTGSTRFDSNEMPLNVSNPVGDHLDGFYVQESGAACECLRISKIDYVELIFAAPHTEPIPNGSLVRVYGIYNTTPGTRCNLPTSFNVRSIEIIGERTPGGDN